MPPRKLFFVVNVDLFFLTHRLEIARGALARGYEVHIATQLTHHEQDLRAFGFQTHPLRIDRGSGGLLDTLRTITDILALYRQVRPDIVQLVTIKPVLLGGIAARLARVPAMVAAVSGLGFVFVAKGAKAHLRRMVVGWMYRLALGHGNSRVIFQNQDDAAAVRQMANLREGAIAIIRGSGVDLSKYQFTDMPRGLPVVLLASRMLADKGVREFVEAAILLGQRPVAHKARFVLVGEPDPDNPASLQWPELERWRRTGAVEIWGHRGDMPAVLAQATIVVLPSYREGLPKVLIEAAACGRAVVTTDVPGCRDAITPGVTGLLVPVRNAAALAEAIATLLQDPPRCAAMGLAGRALAEEAFDVQAVVERHLELYAELDRGARP
jgi:glycosyltransferase involved in cell wall biosynthesis